MHRCQNEWKTAVKMPWMKELTRSGATESQVVQKGVAAHDVAAAARMP